MMLKRVMGKASFAKLQDRSGQIQLLRAPRPRRRGAYEAFKHWDLGDIVGARARCSRRRPASCRSTSRRLRLLTKSLRPLPDKFHGLADQEPSYRQRYVDLIMTTEAREVFRKRSALDAASSATSSTRSASSKSRRR